MSDLNSYFNTSNTQMVPTISGLRAIKQGLTRLLLTPKGHNPFDREYGSSLYSLLFESTNFALFDIVRFLYMDITDFEPRISIGMNDIHITRKDNNTYEVSCTFYVPDLGEGSVEVTVAK